MNITVSKIPAEGIHLNFARDSEWLRSALPDDQRLDFTVNAIEVECSIEKTLKNVFIKGSVTANLELECCRCLEMFAYTLKENFRYTAVPAQNVFNDDIELTSEDLDFIHYEEDSIDLDQIIIEQIILNLPIKPICNTACRGLCPLCGKNLNKGQCNHKAKPKDNAFAILKNYKAKKER